MSRNAKRIMAGHICKIAAKTIPRCGWTAIVMLCLGLYMLFPGSQTAQQLYREKHTPFELIGSMDGTTIDLNTLSQIAGVERVSPILQVNCQLTYGKKDVSNQIDAVYASYLNVHLTDGTLFADNTNMPYLVLNKAATRLFAEKDDDPGIAVQEELLLKSGDVETKAQVCGIYQDESETPRIYMSYEVAHKLFGVQFTGTDVAFLLTNKGAVEEASAKLRKHNFSVGANTDTSLAWNLLEQQTWQNFLVGAVLVACSAILTRENLLQERFSSKAEWGILLTNGMSVKKIEQMLLVRIAITELICMFVSIIISETVNTFSWIALGVVPIFILIYSCCVFAKSYEKINHLS